MRIPLLAPLSAVMAGALAAVLFTGTAHAAPSPYTSVLTKNALYKAGKPGVRTCAEPEVRTGSVEEAELYFETVKDCLDRAWAPVVRKAGHRFTKPAFKIITKPGVKNRCGRFPGGAQAAYCPLDRSITFLLSPNIVEEPTDLALMQVLAHEYGHHVQQLTGIMKAADRVMSKGSEDRSLAALRRLELQAQCMSGAFVGRVWDSLGRPDSDWSILTKGTHNAVALDAIGVRSGSDRTHGSDKANAYWLQRGFTSQSAGSCNTWTSSAAQVR
ncbi:neutral zinc metallopeptidase [Nonomuraea sp. NPDC049309]|uniref:neutral zinc metallopeptidase n=1 Tax=Nonomuraea sp. NPDC049309 TaxID=3364350 RepID=UPI003717E923